MERIHKAIIPTAGLGTRFLPFTKTMPKEMLPIVDTPAIHFIVTEAIKAGIEDILIVTSSSKTALENYFDENYELEMRLKELGKYEEADEIHQLPSLAHIFYVRQKEPKGLGNAILAARPFVTGDPVAVLLGDDLIMSQGKPAIRQLMDAYEDKKTAVLGVQKVRHEETKRYGIVNPSKEIRPTDRLFKIIDVVEKPEVDKAPSDYAAVGRYILTPDVFDVLSGVKPDAEGKVQLTEALHLYAKEHSLYAANLDGDRYDVGDKFGYFKATVDAALKRPDMGEDVRAYLRELVKKEKI